MEAKEETSPAAEDRRPSYSLTAPGLASEDDAAVLGGMDFESI